MVLPLIAQWQKAHESDSLFSLAQRVSGCKPSAYLGTTVNDSNYKKKGMIKETLLLMVLHCVEHEQSKHCRAKRSSVVAHIGMF